MAVTRSRRRSALVATLALLGSSLTIANGWRPLSRRGGRRSIPLFLNGLLASEGPLLVGATHLVLARRLFRRTSGPLRPLVILWSLIGAAASVEHYRRARTIGAELEPMVRRELDEPIATSVRDVVPRANHSPWFWLHRSYTTPESRGVAYGEHGVHNTLDVWRRPDVSGLTPVLIQIHGGGWSVGDNRTQGVPLMTHMAEAGWTCVAPRYRLSPRATWPDHVRDIVRVIAWTRTNVERFGGDPSFVAVTGGSAGGHLAALVGLLGNDPLFKTGVEHVDTSVQAVVPFYGIYDWVDDERANNPAVHHLLERHVVKDRRERVPEVFRSASPIEHVSPDAPPFFVLHGTNDSLLHVEPARRFVERLREVSRQPVLYAELPYTQHSFDLFRTPRSRGACEAVNVFLSTLCQRFPSNE